MKANKLYQSLMLVTAMLLGAISVSAQTYVKTFTFNFSPEDFEFSGKENVDILPGMSFYNPKEILWHFGKWETPALLYFEYPILIPDNYRMKEFSYSTDEDTCQIKQITYYPTAEAYRNGTPDTLTVDSIILCPTPLEHSGPGPFPEAPDYPLITYPAEVVHTGNVRWDGYKPEMFEINPFSYHAADRKLVLSTSITLTITIEPDSGFKIPDGRDDDDVEKIKEYVYNPEDVEMETENWTRVNDKAISVQGKEWNLSRIMPHIVSYVYDVKQWIDGDTLVDGKLCKKLYTLTTTEDERISQKEKLEVGYCWQDGDKFYKNGVLMFDFGLKEGEIFSFWEEEETYAIVTHVGDTILTDGVSRKYLTLRHYHPEWDIIAQASDKWIEGIGSLNTGVYDNLFMGVGGFNTTLLSCTLNENVLYEKEGSNQVKVAEKSNGRCHFHLTNSSITCTSPSAIQLEIYTPDAVKVGQSSFHNGEAVVKVDRVPATYLYIVTYPDGRRESGKVMVK